MLKVLIGSIGIIGIFGALVTMSSNMLHANEVFYFNDQNKLVKEQVELRSSLSFLYSNRVGKFVRPYFNRRYICSMLGWYQDSRLSKRAIKPFVKKHKIAMTDFIIPEGGYTSFNDFFIRKLKAGARTIDTNQNVIASPADCKLFIIDNITNESEFFVKETKFNLEKFLNNKELAEQFQHGTLMIMRLAPYDYHRYHFPVDCVPAAHKLINGVFESVNPLVYKAGVQPLTENERHLIMLKTDHFGDVAMMPVGALFVGRIIQTYLPNSPVKKGDEAGYFAFGGSTVVLLFKKGTVKPLARFIQNSAQGFETAVLVGQPLTY